MAANIEKSDQEHDLGKVFGWILFIFFFSFFRAIIFILHSKENEWDHKMTVSGKIVFDGSGIFGVNLNNFFLSLR